MKNGELLLWGLHRGGPRVRERSRLQGSFGDKVFRCPPVTGGCVLRGAATLPHPWHCSPAEHRRGPGTPSATAPRVLPMSQGLGRT